MKSENGTLVFSQGWLVVLSAVITMNWSCGGVSRNDSGVDGKQADSYRPDTGKVTGTEGGSCYANGTCNSGLVCLSKVCVRMPDAAIPDTGGKSVADQKVLDLPAPDLVLSDQAMDQTVSDHIVPDTAMPDQTLPDQAVPDQVVLDQMAPDQKVPTKKMSDDTFSDFAKGILSEGGLKLYVSAKGNVQMIDRGDVNGDGYTDIIASNSRDGSNVFLNSYIYWGSSKGFIPTSRHELPTVQAGGNIGADFNDDGYVDVAFANYGTVKPPHHFNSYVYYGGPKGYSTSNRIGLPTIGGVSVTVADINKDGYLDLVYANRHDGTTFSLNSYIYFGSSKGFSTNNRSLLPTEGAYSLCVADVNDDSYLDVFFGNLHAVNSYIYWGSAGGFTTSKRDSSLPKAIGCTFADLDNDNDLDVVIASPDKNVNSYIYWRESSGYSNSKRTSLPTMNVWEASVADVNNDTFLDVAFPSSSNGSSYKINSYIYTGATVGYLATNRIKLPSVGGSSMQFADYNSDGHIDCFLTNARDQGQFKQNSYLYWGAKTGFSSPNKAQLPTIGANFSRTTDYGSIYNRKPLQTYISRVHDSGLSSPKYISLQWTAKVPKKTTLEFQIRSSTNKTSLSKANWYGPTSSSSSYEAKTSTMFNPSTNSTGTFNLNKVHGGHRYIQYKVIFEQGYDFANTPVLDKVDIEFF